MTELENIWNHSSCLTKDQIIDYLNASMSKEEVRVVEMHINDCPLCSDAIDGILEHSLSNSEDLLLKSQQQFQDLLSSKNELKKSEPQVIETTPVKAHSTKPNLKPHWKKWYIAAGLLILLSGAYSVYYITEQIPQKNTVSLNTHSSVVEKKTSSPPKEVHVLTVDPYESKSTDIPPTPSREETSQIAVIETKNSNADIVAPPPPTQLSQTPQKTILADEPPITTSQVAAIESDAPLNTPTIVTDNSEKTNFNTDESLSTNNFNDFVNANKKATTSSERKRAIAPTILKEAARATSITESVSSSAVSDKPSSQELNLENAIKDYEKGYFVKSIQSFEKLLSTPGNNDVNEIKLYLAKAYHKTGNNQKAILLLNELVNDPRHGSSAQELLKKWTK